MSLHEYKNEVREFLIRMGSLNGDNSQKVTWLNEEFELLKKAVNASERDKIQHQLSICYICYLKWRPIMILI